MPSSQQLKHLDVIFPSADLATNPMKEDERNTGK
jgi:hypothetical protein